METFAEWLQDEINHRKMLQADLARTSGLKTATISRLINGTRQPGHEACEKIATAFGYPREVVFRAAGLLPPLPTPDAELKERMDHSWAELTREDQEDVLSYIEFKKTRKVPITTLAKPAIQPRKKRQGKTPGEVVKEDS